MNPATAFSNILSSNAYLGLMNLISFIGSFLTSPIWFGVSLMNLLVIAFCIHFVIGIMLGGIAPLSRLERNPTLSDNSYKGVHSSMPVSSDFNSDMKLKGTYVGGGKY